MEHFPRCSLASCSRWGFHCLLVPVVVHNMQLGLFSPSGEDSW